MALRFLYALAGLVLAYGAAGGIALYNVVFDIGFVLVAFAAAVGYRAERSFRSAWLALLVFCLRPCADVWLDLEHAPRRSPRSWES